MKYFILTILFFSSFLFSEEFKWEKQPDKICILVVAAHPDDEAGALGSTISYYTAGLKLPVIWVSMTSGGAWAGDSMSNAKYTEREDLREKESLNAARNYGLKNPPLFPRFKDCCIKAPSVDDNWVNWGGKDNAVEYLVKIIRKYKPDIIVTHATDGEYGHKNHVGCAYAVMEAFDAAGDPSKFKYMLDDYPAWQPKKCYLHNYQENNFKHYWNEKLDSLNDKTAAELTTNGIRCHKSQGMENATASVATAFGLYKSTVGLDIIKKNFLENIDLSLYPDYTGNKK